MGQHGQVAEQQAEQLHSQRQSKRPLRVPWQSQAAMQALEACVAKQKAVSAIDSATMAGLFPSRQQQQSSVGLQLNTSLTEQMYSSFVSGM